MADTDHHRYLESKRITWYSIWGNTFLSIIKILGGYFGHSQALLADGVHSFSDLLSDFLVIFAAKYGSQDADANHPYGHGRIETLGALAVALIVFLAAVGILWDASHQLWYGYDRNSLHPYILILAGISIIVNEAIYRITLKIANKLNSQLLRANAIHSRIDGLSSVVVLIGAAGALLGYPILDTLAAMVVGLMVMHMSYELAKPSLFELVDTALPTEDIEHIKLIINKTPGVRSMHQLRTRSIRNQAFVDVHILVDPRITVSEGHHIGEHVESRLKSECNNVRDVTVHIDPEDDELEPVSASLPSRKMLLDVCKKSLEGCPYFEKIARIDLHYLAGKVHVDILFYALPNIDSSVTSAYQKALLSVDDVAHVNVYVMA